MKKNVFFSWYAVCLTCITFLHLSEAALSQVAFSPNTWSGIATGITNFTNMPAGDCGGAVFSNMGRGPGLGSTTATNGFNSSGFAFTSYAAAEPDDYVWFKIKAGSASLSIDSIKLILSRSSTGPANVTMSYRMSTNSSAVPATQLSALVVTPTTTTSTGAPYTFIPSSVINVAAGDSIFFRIVGWGGGTSGSMRVMNGSSIWGHENCTINSILTSGWTPNVFCVSATAGKAMDVPFTASGTINAGNQYNIQLSDSPSFGTFSSVGSLNSSASTGLVNGLIPASTPPGTYYVRIASTDPVINGNSVTITVAEDVSASISSQNVSCNGSGDGSGDVTVLTGTVPYAHSWSNMETTEDIGSLVPGSYTDTITDANGCKTTIGFSITEPAPITWNSIVTNVTCNGSNNGMANITTSGGTPAYTWAWTNSGVPVASTEDITDLGAGTYVVEITDDNNCVFTDSVTITEPLALVLDTDATDASCYGSANGMAELDVTGGTAPYTFAWTDAAGDTLTNTEDLPAVAAGTYTILLEDANGCTGTTAVVIGEPDSVSIIPGTIVPASCATCGDGSVTVAVNGGTPGYSYLWNNGDNDLMAENLMPGNYCIEVTDANGCSSTQCYTVSFTTGLHAANNTNAFNIYPNPSDGRTICITGEHTAHAQVTIKDVDGKMVFTEELHEGLNKLTLSLQTGIYFCTISQNQAAHITCKLVIR